MTTTQDTLKEALKAIQALREWVKAVPKETPLPAMPGVDGDWLDDVESKLSKMPAVEALVAERDALRARLAQADKQEPELTSPEVNDACWAFVEAMPHRLPGPVFNVLKPAILSAIRTYLKAAKAPQPAAQDSYADIWNALQRIESAAVLLPTFQVTHEGGIDAVAQNIVDAITKLAAPEKQEPVAWCQLGLDRKKIVYFDGKPVIMTGLVGNECHPDALYTHPSPQPAALQPLTPIEGDLMPPLGSSVMIHLAREDKWVERTVVGYYVWEAFETDRLHRVFVRVQDSDGVLNARMLGDIRPVEAAHGIGAKP